MTEQKIERVRVWPREGLIIRDEVTRQPIEPGQEVNRTRFIDRRISDGDLLEAEPTTEQRGAKPELREALRQKKEG